MQHDRPTERLWPHASALVHPQPEGQEMTTPDHTGIRARLAAATEALSPEAAEVVSIPIPLREASALLAERDDLAAENQRLRDTIQAATEKHRRVPVYDYSPTCDDEGHELSEAVIDGEPICLTCPPVSHTCAECGEIVHAASGDEFPEWPCDTARALGVSGE